LAQSRPRRFVLREDRFGRVFPALPPVRGSEPGSGRGRDIGKFGGMLDWVGLRVPEWLGVKVAR